MEMVWKDMMLIRMNSIGKEEQIMKKLLAFFALGLMMMPVSCVKEQFSGNGQGVPVTALTFKAVMEGTTKSTLDENTGKVAWAVGDAIKFAWELDGKEGVGYAESAALTVINDDGSVDFTADAPSVFLEKTEEEYKNEGGKSLHLYAVYPYGVEVDYSNASDFVLTVPSEQDGSFANASIALAKWNKNAPTDPLVFQNLCGLLQIQIADANAKKLVITSSTDIAGKASITFPKDNSGPVVKTMMEASKSVSVLLNGVGTYYVAVYPGELSDVYVEVFNDSDNLIGDRVANNSIPVSRSQVRKLGTIGTGFGDRFYVKEGGSGDMTGSSWDNAADAVGLKTQLTKGELKKIYVAAGTFAATGDMLKITSAAADYSIYGGYPSNSTGYAIKNRNVEINKTIFSGEGSKRVFVMTNGKALLDGVTIDNAAYNNKSDVGSAIIIAGAVKASFNNCTISNNTFTNASTSNVTTQPGGVVRVTKMSNVTFTGCLFSDNSTNARGGVIYQNAEGGTLTINGCTFQGNRAEGIGGVIYTIGTVNFQDCVFDNNTSPNGGAIGAGDAAVVKCKNCVFENNTSTTNGGTLYFNALTSSDSIFENCAFNANSTSGFGGAAGAAGSPATIGTVTFKFCSFNANEATNGGGALWARAANYKVQDCVFIDNKTTGATTKGDALLIDNSKNVFIYADRCYFSYTAADKIGKYCVIANTNTGTGASLCLNNCVVAGYWGNGLRQISNAGASKIVLVNSTLYGQMSTSIVENISTGSVDVVNCIVPNSASTGTGKSFINTNGGRVSVKNSLYTTSGENVTVDASLSGIKVAASSPNFPTDEIWYKGGSADMYTNNNVSKYSVSDNREYVYFYKWNGTYPSGMSFTNSTKTAVEANVRAVDESFAAWADMSVDIRGMARDTQSMWPGSYQGTISANVENLNVK